MLVSARAEALSYSAVKLFSKNSNLFKHGTWTLQTDRRTDGQLTVAAPRSALASRGKNDKRNMHQMNVRFKNKIRSDRTDRTIAQTQLLRFVVDLLYNKSATSWHDVGLRINTSASTRRSDDASTRLLCWSQILKLLYNKSSGFVRPIQQIHIHNKSKFCIRILGWQLYVV